MESEVPQVESAIEGANANVIVQLTADDCAALIEMVDAMQAGSVTGLLALLAREWRDQRRNGTGSWPTLEAAMIRARLGPTPDGDTLFTR